MISTVKRSDPKTSKGYRLKNSTHSMIERIQSITNGSKDFVLSRAVRLYYNEINPANRLPAQESKKNHKKHE